MIVPDVMMKTTDELVLLFNALADPTRLRLLNLMREGEVCVCFFVEILRENQPKISRHLAYLRRAGVVAPRRDGKWMHYRLVEPTLPAAQAVLREVLAWMRGEPEMQRDVERLRTVCCAPTLPVQLQGAPVPIRLPVL